MLKEAMLYFVGPEALASNLMNETMDFSYFAKNNGGMDYGQDKPMGQKGGSEKLNDSINKIFLQFRRRQAKTKKTPIIP